VIFKLTVQSGKVRLSLPLALALALALPLSLPPNQVIEAYSYFAAEGEVTLIPYARSLTHSSSHTPDP